MATRKSQRIAIWIIAIIMLVGTIGGLIAMVMAPSNQAADNAKYEAEMAKYQKEYEKYLDKTEVEDQKMSDKYYEEFNSYSSRVAKFDKNTAEELEKEKVEDLKQGDGAEIKGDTKFAAYYIGWNPEGKIFDQSIEDGKLKAPLYRSTLDEGLEDASLIEGWKTGMLGMKIGGVREVTIPSELAYGEMGQGEDIPANAPIKFVIMAVEPPVDIAEPQPSKFLLEEEARRGARGIY